MEEQKAVKNEADNNDPRFVKRLKARKQETLDTLVNLFFTHRSGLKDPEGEEASTLFAHYRNMWINECKEFNKKNRRPFTLRGAAFTDQVTKIIEMEKTNQKKAEEENRANDFKHWFRRSGGWKNDFFRALRFWLKVYGNKEKQTQLWKNYYLTTLV